MKPERCAEVLQAGYESAQERMKQRPARAEYPHDYHRLYEWLEEKLYNLYEAIELKQYGHIYTMSGEIIITASEIAELVKTRLEGPKEKKNEMADS